MPDEPTERSKSGSPIYRHEAADRDWTPPESSGANLKAVEAHLAKYIAPVENVFHELVSDLVHLDILMIPPTVDRPFHVLVTSGMSDLAMTVPEGMEFFRRAELLIALPADWPLEGPRFEDERAYWPIRWLKTLGRLPHEYQTWLGYGHTVPNGDPAEPIADTRFTGVMLNFAAWLPAEFFRLELSEGEGVCFYQMTPLYPEEMAFKLAKGAEPLDDLFDARGIDFVLDVGRANVAKKRRWFGLF
ncbi:MAG: hypothetical protein BGO49_29565 [Planctomycetales bacterium 71-10]|nr:MAG: hypothetical protein BGO49_29565 [Planctomycetales bacterium 71-10]